MASTVVKVEKSGKADGYPLSTQVVQLPGAASAQVSAQFLMPAVGASVTFSVNSTSSLAMGINIQIPNSVAGANPAVLLITALTQTKITAKRLS